MSISSLANNDLAIVIRKLNGSLRGKKIAVLGYAFKKDTSDTRESQAAEVIRLLQQESPSEIAIYDPKCFKEVIEQELSGGDVRTTISVCDSPAEACARASAVLILTEWDQFAFPAPRNDFVAAKKTKQFHAYDRLRPEPDCIAFCEECANSHGTAKRTWEGSMDWAQVAATMSGPRLVFDGRGVITDHAGLTKMGFQVESIGKSSLMEIF